MNQYMVASRHDAVAGIHNYAAQATPVPKAPSNHNFLVNSFTTQEIRRILDMLLAHSDALPTELQYALKNNDFDKIVHFLMSAIKTGHKEIFLPYYLPPTSLVELQVCHDPLSVQLMSKYGISIPSLEHAEIHL